MLGSILALSVLFGPIFSLGKYLNGPEEADGKTWDMIVVGSGPGGAVIASRLSEVSTLRVLLIEAGASDLDYPDIAIPQRVFQLWPDKQVDFNYTYLATPFTANRVVQIPRGRTLGGSSSISVLLQTHGSKEWWDDFSDGVGDPGLSFDNMQPYFKKFEHWVAPMDGHDASGEYDSSLHGTSGPVGVTVSNFNYPGHTEIIAAAGEVLSPHFDFKQDVDSGNMLGLGWAQMNQGGGVRMSAAAAYIHANGVSSRPNLDVLLSTTVTRILFKPSSRTSAKLIVSGVEFAQSSEGPRYQAHVNDEVIVSGGSINTPLLLMLSGIGDTEELSAAGIETILDRPAVGKNYQDHPALLSYWELNTTYRGSSDDQFRNATLNEEVVAEWNSDHTGPLSNAACSVWVWGRLDANDTIFEQFPDPSPGGNSPNYETLFCDGLVGPPLPATGHFITTEQVVISPQARGWIKLNGTDPFQLPIINPNFLDNDFDMHVLRTSLRRTRQFLETAPGLKGFIGDRYGSQVGLETDAELDGFIRNNIGTLWHPSSSCSMGKAGTDDGVVDPQYLVKGVANLRIVDLSIVPNNTAGHPTGMLEAIAERAADIIKKVYSHQ